MRITRPSPLDRIGARPRLATVVLLACLAVAGGVLADDPTPRQITIQGVLSDTTGPQTVPADGTFTMSFAVFDAELGGALVASHGPVSVAVHDGVYEVSISLDLAALSGADRWLETTIDGETLTPRLRLANAPYAHVAEAIGSLTPEGLQVELSLIQVNVSAEIASVISDHEGEADPHAPYVLEQELPLRVVCDGIDDTARIQDAILAAPEVLIDSGSQCVVRHAAADHALLIDKSGFRLTLEADSVIRLDDGEATGAQTLYLLQIGTESSATSDVTILGPGTLDGNGGNNPLVGGDYDRRAGVAVVGQASSIEIANLRLEDSSGCAVLIRGNAGTQNAEDVRVRDNFMTLNAEGVLFENADEVGISRNHIRDVLARDGLRPGTGSDGWLIESNLIVQDGAVSSGAGIHVATGAGGGSIVGNLIAGHGDGVDVEAPDSVVVSGNQVDYAGSSGSGIRIRPGGSPMQRCSVEDNFVEGFQFGIRIDGNDVKVSGNYLLEPGEAGIQWDQGDRGQIRANVLLDPGQLGMRFTSGTGLSVADNRISDSRGTPLMTHGARFEAGVSATRFVRNEISGHTAAAVVDETSGQIALRRNVGFVTETRGTATISAGSTVYTVAHGLDVAPTVAGISVTPTNDLGQASRFWIANVAAASFQIRVDVQPGGSGATFSWTAVSE
ncbi:MAG: right-handed parallel beta-helix repeat-containing protein [bacterium]|nr:right-handed parallel beta-helix repeat-containing protein [bacterium]